MTKNTTKNTTSKATKNASETPGNYKISKKFDGNGKYFSFTS